MSAEKTLFDHDLVHKCISKVIHAYSVNPYLWHGDCAAVEHQSQRLPVYSKQKGFGLVSISLKRHGCRSSKTLMENLSSWCIVLLTFQ